MDRITCEIEEHEGNGSIEVRGVAAAAEAVSGSFRFLVTQHGRGGSSHVAQQGVFTLQPNVPQTPGFVSVTAGQGDTYSASLSLLVDGEETTCSAGTV